MLTFSLNNQFLALDESASVRMQWVNPACQMDNIGGDVGLGIDIPVNETNRAILGNPERFEKYNSPAALTKVNKFPGFEIRYSGVLLMSGTLNITRADGTSYQGWLQSEVGVMGEAQREKFITEMEWPAEQVFENKTTYTEAEDDYCTAQVINRYFWEGKGREIVDDKTYKNEDGEDETGNDKISWLSSEFRRVFKYIVNKRDETGKASTEGSACVVSPFLFLKYVVKEALRHNQWFIENNCFSKEMFDSLILYNNFSITKQEFTTEGGVVPWYNEEADEWQQKYIEKIIDLGWLVQDFNYADLLPRYSMKDFLIGLQNYFNIVFVFRKHNKVDIIDREDILQNRRWNTDTSEYETLNPIDIDDYFVDQWEIGDPKDLRLKFMSEYDKNDSFSGDEWHDLSDRIEFMAADVETKEQLEAITNDPIGTIRRVKTEDRYYEFKWTVNISIDPITLWEIHTDILSWEFASVGPQHYFFGQGEEDEEIKTAISTLHNTSILEGSTIDWFHPVVLQKGNMAYMRALWNDFSPRVLFYRGNVRATIGNNAFNDNWQVNDADALILQWDGEYGLFNRRWKRWSHFWKTRQAVEGRFNLALNLIVHITENITQKVSTHHGDLIIEEMEVEIGLNMVGVTTIKGYKL